MFCFSLIDDVTKQNVCSACLNHIHDNEYIEALNKEWHSDCFRYMFVLQLLKFQLFNPFASVKILNSQFVIKCRCSVCDETLSDWYFEKGDILFCQMHYWAKYGQSCQQCSQVIAIFGLRSNNLICLCLVDNWWSCHGCWWPQISPRVLSV